MAKQLFVFGPIGAGIFVGSATHPVVGILAFFIVGAVLLPLARA